MILQCIFVCLLISLTLGKMWCISCHILFLCICGISFIEIYHFAFQGSHAVLQLAFPTAPHNLEISFLQVKIDLLVFLIAAQNFIACML